MDVSFQLYSSRDVASQTAFLSDLAGFGYTQVEGFGGVYDDPAGFRAAMDDAGLTMPSAHFAVAALENDWEGQIAIARALGVSLLVGPYLMPEDRPTDAAGYAALAQRLAAIGAKAKAEGFGFAWHNHDFELEALADGSIPMDIILTEAPEIGWEADLAWVVRGNADPAAWLRKYGARIVSIHVKDIAEAGTKLDEDGWADLGQGTIDWAGLHAISKEVAPDALRVMEHDKPSDVHRFALNSITAFQTL